MFEGVSFDCTLKLFEEVDTMLDAFGFAEVSINESLEFCVKLGNGDVEGDILFIKGAVGKVKEISFSFLLEVVSDVVEFVDDDIHFLQIKLSKGIKLLNIGEDFN